MIVASTPQNAAIACKKQDLNLREGVIVANTAMNAAIPCKKQDLNLRGRGDRCEHSNECCDTL